MIEYMARGSSTAEPTERAQWLSGLGTGTSFNPAIGMYQAEDWAGRPDRQNPDLFGVNTQARALADNYNNLRGYGVQEVSANNENGTETLDNRVRVDPWSGRLSSAPISKNIFGLADQPTYNSIADLAPTPGTDFNKARELATELRGLSGSALTKRLREREVQDTLNPFAFQMGDEPASVGYATFANDRAADMLMGRIGQAEADYNAKLEPFNAAREQYDSAWGQIQEQYLSPTLDKQLRELMPDDGKSFDNAFTTNYDHHINTLNYVLKGKTGIEDLRDLASTTHDGRTVIYNRRTGQEVDPELLNYKGGSNDGNVSFKLKATEGGGVTFDTKFKKPSMWGGGNWINVVAPMALGLFAGGALSGALTKAFSGGAATAGLGASVAGKALSGGLVSAAMGGNPVTGMLGGALGVGTGMAGSVVGDAIGGTAGKVLGGAVSGGLSSAILGGDMQTGLLGGAMGSVMPSPAPTQASATPTASRFQISNMIFGGKT